MRAIGSDIPIEIIKTPFERVITTIRYKGHSKGCGRERAQLITMPDSKT